MSSATSLAKRGSFCDVLDDERRARREHPARDARARRGSACRAACPRPRPTTASKTSSSVSSSRSRIDDAFAPKIERATSTIAERSARNDSSEPTTPAATAARRSGWSVMSHLRRSSRSDRGRSSAGTASARDASRGSGRRSSVMCGVAKLFPETVSDCGRRATAPRRSRRVRRTRPAGSGCRRSRAGRAPRGSRPR